MYIDSRRKVSQRDTTYAMPVPGGTVLRVVTRLGGGLTSSMVFVPAVSEPEEEKVEPVKKPAAKKPAAKKEPAAKKPAAKKEPAKKAAPKKK